MAKGRYVISTYVVRLRHDDGYLNVQTAAQNAEVAAQLVTDAYHAPSRAVVSVKRIPKHRVRAW